MLVLSLILLACAKPTTAYAAKHCYTTENVSVLNAKGKIVSKIAAGTTFVYKKSKQGYVMFEYYGKTRYAKSDHLVLNKSLPAYVRSCPQNFGLRLKTLEKGKVYRHTNTGSKSIQRYADSELFNVQRELTNWYQVSVDGRVGYVQKSNVSAYHWVDVTSFYKATGKTKREKIVNYAKKFVGNPYVWGGTSLTSGADCSGFVGSVMKHFGINLPRCSYQQAEVGTLVNKKNIKPGDLIFYRRGSRVGHVVMYAGNGMVVEAKGRAYGIVVSKANLADAYCIRNVLD